MLCVKNSENAGDSPVVWPRLLPCGSSVAAKWGAPVPAAALGFLLLEDGSFS